MLAADDESLLGLAVSFYDLHQSSFCAFYAIRCDSLVYEGYEKVVKGRSL